jgi:hypothetical protein
VNGGKVLVLSAGKGESLSSLGAEPVVGDVTQARDSGTRRGGLLGHTFGPGRRDPENVEALTIEECTGRVSRSGPFG